MRTAIPVVATLAAATLLAGCGGGGATTEQIVLYIHRPAPASETKHVVVKVLPRVGLVLVDGEGYPLYAFVADRPGARCTGACLASWPLYRLLPANALDISPLLTKELIHIGHAPEGGRTVSYSGWLLHNFAGDRTPGRANGQGAQSYGGHWYLIARDGSLVKQPT